MLCGLTAAAPKYGGTPAYVTYGDGGAGIRRARSADLRGYRCVNRLFKVGDHVPAAGLDGGSDQLFLAREMVVEGTLGDVEPVRDVVEADGVVAAPTDFSRGQTRNLCFGLGPHYCIGAPLGKLMVRVAFGELLDRVAHLQRDISVPLNRRDGLSRPFRELRVTFEAR